MSRTTQPAVFAPDYAPEEIAEIAAKLRVAAGLPKEPTGDVCRREALAVKAARLERLFGAKTAWLSQF